MTLPKRAAALIFLLVGAVSLGGGGYIQAKAWLAQILLEQAWRDTLAARAFSGEEAVVYKPWPWADTYPVGLMEAPRLAARWVVLEGASGRNLAFGPAHMEASAVVGEPGMAVVSGHRDTHFLALRDLREGDVVRWQTPAGQWLEFSVTGAQVVNADEVMLALPGADAASSAMPPRLVLTTCYPFDGPVGGPLRKLFYLEPAPQTFAL
ncbi:class GN sortase [Hahella sp. HN01]|uniref:class GN sortase n=1 Tax=Hahella sp. HN01 TaxID=2847262 RepID=UPI001C1ED9ED|nr:class GN sortase [Hahella sp. HN01]MBU6950258.1 class GN sortase [Hahella sp. HN01]